MSSNAIYTSLSLISLVSLVGAGVAVGSGVGMMTLAMAEEEKHKQAAPVMAHQPLEPRVVSLARRTAASSQQ